MGQVYKESFLCKIGIIPFCKKNHSLLTQESFLFDTGIIPESKRNHSFLTQESFLFDSRNDNLSFLLVTLSFFFTGNIPQFSWNWGKLSWDVKCFPTNKGMLSLKLGKLSSLWIYFQGTFPPSFGTICLWIILILWSATERYAHFRRDRMSRTRVSRGLTLPWTLTRIVRPDT